MRYALLVLLLTASAPTRPLDPALVESALRRTDLAHQHRGVDVGQGTKVLGPTARPVIRLIAGERRLRGECGFQPLGLPATTRLVMMPDEARHQHNDPNCDEDHIDEAGHND